MNRNGWDPGLKSKGLTELAVKALVNWNRYASMIANNDMERAKGALLDETVRLNHPKDCDEWVLTGFIVQL